MEKFILLHEYKTNLPIVINVKHIVSINKRQGAESPTVIGVDVAGISDNSYCMQRFTKVNESTERIYAMLTNQQEDTVKA